MLPSTRLCETNSALGTVYDKENMPAPPVAKPADTATKSALQRASHHQNNNNNNNNNHSNSNSISPLADEADGLPSAKRRKLSIRGRQTTLENYILPNAGPPRPPTKLSRLQPRGQLIETVNGVQTQIDPSSLRIPPQDTSSRTSSRTPPASQLQQQPQPAGGTSEKQEDKRTLRSHDDGPKLKSELAIYFPNYDEIIFDPPQEAEFITVDSVIFITDDNPKQPKKEHASPVKSPKNSKISPQNGRPPPNHASPLPSTPQRNLSNQYNGSPSLSLDFVAKTLPENPEDPLTDDFYIKSHRRAERKEKQLRNIEKERAMHEKVQLDRLLDGLLGHDWLRVMGITAITDLEAKKYEPKREYFVVEVQALVDKFRQWKEQEKKRQKLKKEAVTAIKEPVDDRESDVGSVDPSSSDLNASAALQLQQETASAVKSAAVAARANKSKAVVTKSQQTPKPPPVYVPPPPEVPITSFFAKRHLRDAALGKSRHGRNVVAFGHPVPDLPEAEFQLPDDFVTEDVIRANARERRRRKRATAIDARQN